MSGDHMPQANNERDWYERRGERSLSQWQVDELMRKRCEEQGHVMENCCSVTFRIYQKCKYCGKEI